MDIIVVHTEGAEFSALEKYLSCVSKARKSVVLKKASDEDKVQSLVAALLLRSELSKRLGIPHGKVAFEKGPHGKPYIKGGGAQFSAALRCNNRSIAAGRGVEKPENRRQKKVSDHFRPPQKYF